MNVEPIAIDDAYRVMRAVFMRLDATATAQGKAETLAEMQKRFSLAVALDKLGDALDILREQR